jgi:PAS domain S-box-containing protein
MNQSAAVGGVDQGLPYLCQVLEQNREALARECFARLAEQAEMVPAVRGLTIAEVDAEVLALTTALRGAAAGAWGAMESLLERLASFAVQGEMTFASWCHAAAACAGLANRRLVDSLGQEPKRLVATLDALQALLARASTAVEQARVASKDQLVRSAQASTRTAPEASEARFLRIFESGIISVLVCDLIGNIKDANDAFLAMVGYTRDELTSGKIDWLEMTPPEWRHLDADAIEQLKARGVTRTWEKEYFRKDGTRVPILVGVAMLSDSECIAFVLDVTERKRWEQLRIRALELETQNRRIQEASRLKSEFLANMSHELRTPLNSIIGFADLLHDREISIDSPQHKEFLADILKSGRHLLQIINDVLDLAKVEAGKIEFRPVRVALEPALSEAAAILRTIAAGKQIAVEIQIDRNLHEVTLDPARLKQVLYNYLSNALKFTEQGGRVTIRAQPEGSDFFRLEVQDNGIGIAPADRSRLFVEFQQLDIGPTKRHQGTGLGLALTRRIVEAQGGSVGVTSTIGRGSIFYAVLPRLACSLDLPAEPRRKPVDDNQDLVTTILVVEDDIQDRRLLMKTLEHTGYRVEAVSTGAEAIARCHERAFDAITLDLLLPDITGLEVLHRLRTSGKNLASPIIVVSVVAERGIVSGYAVHDYLRKPIESAELLGSLERAGVQPASSNNTILVVDDDPQALKLMEATLCRLGYRADCQSNAESALAVLAGRRPAAVILDLIMPEVDGFEFLARLRREPENHDLPVIVWTMKDLTRLDLETLHELAQAVVAKGNPTASLTDQLRSLLAKAVPPAEASA